MNKLNTLRCAVLCAASTVATIAAADPVAFDVDAIDAIYNANNPGMYADGNPVSFTLPTGATSFTLSISGGQVSFNGGGNQNDADGVGAAVSSSSNTGTFTIAGITAPNAGYLVGLFLGATTGSTPYSTTYVTTDFASYSPLLQQVFFVGDGLTGDGTGTSQTFVVPTGALTLYLGFSDAGGYNGSPSSYGDNSGFFSGAVTFATQVVVTPPPPPSNGVPEPAELALLGFGALAAGLVRRKR